MRNAASMENGPTLQTATLYGFWICQNGSKWLNRIRTTLRAGQTNRLCRDVKSRGLVVIALCWLGCFPDACRSPH
jgi:hypothetical protein